MVDNLNSIPMHTQRSYGTCIGLVGGKNYETVVATLWLKKLCVCFYYTNNFILNQEEKQEA